MYEASFRVVVESAPDGIVIVDAEGRIILVDAAALFKEAGVQWSLNAPAHFVADGP